MTGAVYAQIGIALCGVTAVLLSQASTDRTRRFACLFGLAGQPFWMYAAYTAQQWGILMLTLFYGFAWGKGLWWYWIKGGGHGAVDKLGTRSAKEVAE